LDTHVSPISFSGSASIKSSSSQPKTSLSSLPSQTKSIVSNHPQPEQNLPPSSSLSHSQTLPSRSRHVTHESQSASIFSREYPRPRSRSSIDIRSELDELGFSQPNRSLRDLKRTREGGSERVGKSALNKEVSPIPTSPVPPARAMSPSFASSNSPLSPIKMEELTRGLIQSSPQTLNQTSKVTPPVPQPQQAQPTPPPQKPKRPRTFLGISLGKKKEDKIEKSTKSPMKSQISGPSEIFASGSQVLDIFKLEHFKIPSSPPLSPITSGTGHFSTPGSPDPKLSFSSDPFRRIIIPPMNLAQGLAGMEDHPLSLSSPIMKGISETSSPSNSRKPLVSFQDSNAEQWKL
jgi:hypothetical protein